MVDEPKEFWFNIKTGLVEEGKQTAAIYRVGPFASRSEAEKALETLANRSKSWQSEDEHDE
ncbi:MAG: hypothetical protein RL149_510 [Actinomycetota bacterium]|jgi:uncharacterized protein YfcZ (UPF0381/DUF406 family)